MRKSTAVLTIVSISLAATSLWMWHGLVNERARADDLQSRIESMERAADAAMPDFALSAESVPDASGIVDETATTKQAPDRKDINAEQSRLLQNEGYREARRRVRQLELAWGHIDLAKILGISQETADRLIALLVDRELQSQSRPFYNPRNEKELRIRQMESQQYQHEEDAAISEVIGAGRLPKWKEYQASLPVRHEVNSFAAELFTGAEPLREDQVEPLISAIYTERRRSRQELTEYTQTLDWSEAMSQQSHLYRNQRAAELNKAAQERIQAKASSILSAKQLAVLDERMRRDRELDDAESEAFRAMIEAAPVSGGKN